MLLPTELVSSVSVTTAKPNHLLLALDRDGSLMWTLEAAEKRFAVFLTGKYATQAFEISENSGGSGVGVGGPLTVRVDPASASTEALPWSLRATDGSLFVGFYAEQRDGFPERFWAKVETFETSQDPTLYFSRWEFGIQIDGEWTAVVTVADGTLTSPLAA